MPTAPIRVLIVDDSAAMRQLLTQIVTSDPDIEVIGTAPDPCLARAKIRELKPDVVTLDVEMPCMDSLAFLEKLMSAHPLPVVMVSSLTQTSCDITLKALELGAVDFFPRPTLDTLQNMANGAQHIIAKVKAASRAHVQPRAASASTTERGMAPLRATAAYGMTHKLIAIGASTGGTEAIRSVLTELPADTPGIVIVQHMPPGFTASFAKRLDGLCNIRVREAQDGDRVLPGHALIAPGSLHTAIARSGAEYVVRVFAAPPVNHHRPSVDVLFDSVAEHAGKNAVAAILTGMGDDGARGLRRIRDAGARTIAQDEATCVVYGMPREAIARGGAEFVLPLDRIASNLRSLVSASSKAA